MEAVVDTFGEVSDRIEATDLEETSKVTETIAERQEFRNEQMNVGSIR
jgi:hypothetical protein